jgi:hypothetical protein
MVLVLQELHHVDKKIYSQESWLLAVKVKISDILWRLTPNDLMTVQKTGFGRVCTQICRSENVVLWKNQHVEDLLRKNCIQDSI